MNAAPVLNPAVQEAAPARPVARHLKLVPLVGAGQAAPAVEARPTIEPVRQGPAAPQPAAPVGRGRKAWQGLVRGVNWANHATLGAALSFMEQAQAVIAPVLFMGRHAFTLAHATVLLALPALTSYAIWESVPALHQQFAGQLVTRVAFGAGLYVSCAFGLMLTGLLAFHLAMGVVNALGRLARKGEDTFAE